MPASAVPTELTGATTCRIVTQGRVTGDPHTVTVWFAPAGSQLYVAVRHGLSSDWLRNAQAQDHVEVSARKRSWTARATLVGDPDEVHRALEAFATKYAAHKSIIRSWRANPPVFVRLDLDA